MTVRASTNKRAAEEGHGGSPICLTGNYIFPFEVFTVSHCGNYIFPQKKPELPGFFYLTSFFQHLRCIIF
jgi:hypothetical protein